MKTHPFPGIDIKVKNLASRPALSRGSCERLIKRVLKEEGIPCARIFVLFVTAPFIRSLNRKYLSKNVATDVLSFDLRPLRAKGPCLMGDVVVSVEAGLSAARALRVPLRQELSRYLVHGLLHLCGHDDRTPARARKMWKRQESLLKKLKTSRLRT